MKIIDSIREDLKNKEYILIMSNDIRQIMSDIGNLLYTCCMGT